MFEFRSIIMAWFSLLHWQPSPGVEAQPGQKPTQRPKNGPHSYMDLIIGAQNIFHPTKVQESIFFLLYVTSAQILKIYGRIRQSGINQLCHKLLTLRCLIISIFSLSPTVSHQSLYNIATHSHNPCNSHKQTLQKMFQEKCDSIESSNAF